METNNKLAVLQTEVEEKAKTIADITAERDAHTSTIATLRNQLNAERGSGGGQALAQKELKVKY